MINNEYRENKKSGISIDKCNALRSMAQQNVAQMKKERGY
jgi:hypothetical protein